MPTFAYFKGSIANVQVYDVALNASEIKELYKEGINGMPLPGVLVHFNP